MKRNLVLAAALASLAACSSSQVPTDTDLVTLLHSEQSAGKTGDARPLDPHAVQCLSVYSGDAELTQKLPSAALSNAAKLQCRSRVDLWLADQQRNPAKYKFTDISAPAVAKRALALYLANGGVSLNSEEPAPATAQVTPPADANVAPADNVNEGPAPDIIDTLAKADNVCRDIKAAVAKGPFNARLYRYGQNCEGDLKRSRDNVARYREQGRQADIDAEARKMASMSASGERLLGHAKP